MVLSFRSPMLGLSQNLPPALIPSRAGSYFSLAPQCALHPGPCSIAPVLVLAHRPGCPCTGRSRAWPGCTQNWLECSLPSFAYLCKNTLDRRGPQGALRAPGEGCHGDLPLGPREEVAQMVESGVQAAPLRPPGCLSS